MRQKNRSSVDSIKGQFGFLDYEVEEGKKLFFHMSEVQGANGLCPGDVVEFSIVTNQVKSAFRRKNEVCGSLIFFVIFVAAKWKEFGLQCCQNC